VNTSTCNVKRADSSSFHFDEKGGGRGITNRAIGRRERTQTAAAEGLNSEEGKGKAGHTARPCSSRDREGVRPEGKKGKEKEVDVLSIPLDS